MFLDIVCNYGFTISPALHDERLLGRDYDRDGYVLDLIKGVSKKCLKPV